MLGEPLVVVREYAFQWVRPQIDLAELAKLRWIENWAIQRLARHFGIGTDSVYTHLDRALQEGVWKTA